ncbi:TMEM181 [Bugula neritina]|uniref:TMEM181 n=1 Tax=Bugula neritina TaxID=10212 RepID=A0A7J7J730_BUGNE|nr:TMEM181 [Bugula neritina]
MLAPDVIYTDSHNVKLIKNEYGSLVLSVNTSPILTPLNQQLWLLATPVLANKDSNDTVDIAVTPQINFFHVDSEGHEQSELSGPPLSHRRQLTCTSEKCDSLLLLHLGYINHSEYKVTVKLDNTEEVTDLFESITLEFKTYKSAFTQVEIWFRTVFLALTFIFTIWYTRSLKPYHWDDWSIEQKWVMILLPLLLLYNNPLFPLAFIVASFAPFMVDGIFQATFLATLLLYYLCIYHSIREVKRSFVRFYLPKILLVCLIWLIAVVLSTWQAVNERTDPTYNYRVDTVNFMGLKVVLFVLAALYTLFLFYLFITAFIELRNVAYFGLRLRFAAVYMVVIFSVSLAILILRFGTQILDESFVSEISTRYGSAAEFLSLYGLMNFSLYAMAYVYSPSKNALSESRFPDNPAVSMLNESDSESDSDILYGRSKDEKIDYSVNFMGNLDADSD